MPDYAPLHTPAQTFTRTAGAPITGGRVLSVGATDGSVIPAAANDIDFIGVAAHDTANGARVTVHGLKGAIHLLTTTAAAVAVGAPVKAAAAGQVVAAVPGTDADRLIVGIALTGVSAAGGVIEVLGK